MKFLSIVLYPQQIKKNAYKNTYCEVVKKYLLKIKHENCRKLNVFSVLLTYVFVPYDGETKVSFRFTQNKYASVFFFDVSFCKK